MPAKQSCKISLGLIGLGRLGKVYARVLAAFFPQARVVAVADTIAEVAEQIAAAYEVPRWYADSNALLEDGEVDAVVIVTPTHTHKDLVIAAAQRQKAIFCEKPLSLSLAECEQMKQVLSHTGVYFQMGFMRRFDRGYVAAREKITQGAIGTPVMFRATSRDPFLPSLAYADPKSSGGLMLDMGIHDLDLARWFVGEIKAVYAIGGVLAYPEMKTIGDIDNAVISLVFEDGQLGVIDLSRNGVYGYDIATEILGTNGSLRIGYLQETPVLVMTRNCIAHDTVPYFMERFAGAYTTQLQNFVENLLHDRKPPVTIDDGIAALRAAVAATKSFHANKPVNVASVISGDP
ncbi:MAG: inositol 2-dehydrogenase [bacterium]